MKLYGEQDRKTRKIVMSVRLVSEQEELRRDCPTGTGAVALEIDKAKRHAALVFCRECFHGHGASGRDSGRADAGRRRVVCDER